jgi:alcohol dehydrogenase class IV
MQWICQLRTVLNIPNDLRSIDIDTAQSQRIGEMAVADASAAGNPVELSAAMYTRLFERAVLGQSYGASV